MILRIHRCQKPRKSGVIVAGNLILAVIGYRIRIAVRSIRSSDQSSVQGMLEFGGLIHVVAVRALACPVMGV